MPIVPGPQTSWVMRMSTFTQTFSAGATWARPECLAMIFSVIVMPGIDSSSWGENETVSIAARPTSFHDDGGRARCGKAPLQVVSNCSVHYSVRCTLLFYH